MIVLVVDVDGITSDKAKRDAPVAAHANGPGAFAITCARMQNKARKIHVFRPDRNLKPTQNQSQSLCVLRLYPGFRALEIEPLKTLMSEASDHERYCNPLRHGLQDAQRIS